MCDTTATTELAGYQDQMDAITDKIADIHRRMRWTTDFEEYNALEAKLTELEWKRVGVQGAIDALTALINGP